MSRCVAISVQLGPCLILMFNTERVELKGSCKDNKDKQVNSIITRYGADTADFELVAR